jgi:glutaredoxin
MKLELYYFPSCPFCVRVLDIINELKINDKIQLVNIHEDESAYQKHVQTTGRATVPCLYIDNEPMFESADIVSWLRGQF